VKLHYYKDTDSLYIDLADGVSADSREVSADFVVDYDAEGRVVGFDIQHASQHLDLSRVETTDLPLASAF
jgi:uncharacterized protein YuzE